ncbi:hypothetical protein [Paenibacillus glycanilyticus]|uniref:Uncharacterized protein n=1 Tax=Paenibacillus glycanilyticus TaxID=126569 RepID=A0ABQ6GNC6_9BACL|nr:hypothetical protein [Paenibacillus glycanilyticus]GLX70507.1 hypothetical protein MU1_48530 [Paenibacillus glycanilyticus]
MAKLRAGLGACILMLILCGSNLLTDSGNVMNLVLAAICFTAFLALFIVIAFSKPNKTNGWE